MTRLDAARASGRPRRFFLVMAAGAASLVATMLSVTGVSYLNLDRLIREAGHFYAFLLIPAAGHHRHRARDASRESGDQYRGLRGVPLLAEAGAWTLRGRTPTTRGRPEAIGTSTFYVPDETLGYAHAPSTVARHSRSVSETQIYDVIYRTDRWGRRETPTTAGTPLTSFLLFFGDSNTFGEGLSQTETLPDYAGELATGCRPYNYGVSGYGPAQLLALGRLRRLPPEVPEHDGYAIYFSFRPTWVA